MPKLNQILAIEKDKKQKSHAVATKTYQGLQQKELMDGQERSYEPVIDGEGLPSERKPIQFNSQASLLLSLEKTGEYWDVLATKEYGNVKAGADLVIDGETVLENAPVPLLLALEKQLTEMRSVIAAMPLLDPAQNWTWDAQQGCYVSDEVHTIRNKKEPKVITLIPPSEHAGKGEAQILMEEVKAGTWTTRYTSARFSAEDRQAALDRCDAALVAVKMAREEANSTVVADQSFGKDLLLSIFAPVLSH